MDDLHQHEPERAGFPSETDWLGLPPPPIADDFVVRVLDRLQHAGLVAGELPANDLDPNDPGEAAVDLPPGLLASYAPSPVRPDFVARTLARIQRDQAERWRELLLRYESPDPTPDFVGRTLRALASDSRPPATARRLPRPLTLGMLAAAAATVLWLLLPEQSSPLAEFVAGAPASSAYAHSPTLLTHVLAAANAPDAVPALAADAGWLWLATAEAR
jgi:hypothetical protein